MKPSESPSRMVNFFKNLAAFQEKAAGKMVAAWLLLTVLSIPLVLALTLRGDFTALLPETKASVVDLLKIQGKLGKASTLTIAFSGDDITKVRALLTATGQDFDAKIPQHVTSVEWSVKDAQDYIGAHRWLYVPKDDLEEARDALAERLEWERDKAGIGLSLAEKEPADTEAQIKRFKDKEIAAREKGNQFPDGFFQHSEKNIAVIFLRTSIKAGDVESAEALKLEVETRVAALIAKSPESYAGVRLDLGADLMDMLEEVNALAKQVAIATLVTILLVLLSVLIYFRSLRSIPLLGLGLLPPVILTFAVAKLSVGHLNTSTAFLGSIVIGNGVNPNVIWLARYFEERRRGNSIVDSLKQTHLNTYAGTITASLAAGLAYASLIVTDFRGFRDFGIIGGAGMILCWLGAYFLLPAFAVLFDRFRPIALRADASSNLYGMFFSFLVRRAPRLVLATSLLITAASSYLVYDWIRDDPMEYDFRRLQSKRDPSSRVLWVNNAQGQIVNEATTGSAIVVYVDDLKDVDHVVGELKRFASESKVPIFGAVRSLQDFVPTEQKEKLVLIEDLRDLMQEARRFADDETKKQLDEQMPPEDLELVTVNALPDSLTRIYKEVDGSLGRLVFVEHPPERNAWDGAYLVEWSNRVREVRTPDGLRPPVTGNPPVFADLVESIVSEGPKCVAAALSVTILLVLIGFRRWRDRMLTLSSLIGGILWMAATMALAGIRLNFLNFVAFPITFGNGVDYGVNLMQRFLHEEKETPNDPDAVLRAVEGTGGAVVLCSLTTILGYISLYASTNQALNSFGAAMAISEVTCVATAILAVPAWLYLRAKARVSARSSKNSADVG